MSVNHSATETISLSLATAMVALRGRVPAAVDLVIALLGYGAASHACETTE